jgi:hypothetical protein
MSTRPTLLPGQEMLLACWSALTQISPEAKVFRFAATAAAVFPSWTPLNNAILLDAPDGAAAEAAAGMAARGTDGQPLYASLGFEAAGRYEEWISQ